MGCNTCGPGMWWDKEYTKINDQARTYANKENITVAIFKSDGHYKYSAYDTAFSAGETIIDVLLPYSEFAYEQIY